MRRPNVWHDMHMLRPAQLSNDVNANSILFSVCAQCDVMEQISKFACHAIRHVASPSVTYAPVISGPVTDHVVSTRVNNNGNLIY